MAVNGHVDTKGDLEPVCHIVTPIGMLGYGLDELATRATLAALVPTGVPTALILDSGSTDSGPSKLALGNMSCQRMAYVRDLSKLLKLVHDFEVPLVFSSAGGAGIDEHVEGMIGIIEEIAAKEGNEYVNVCQELLMMNEILTVMQTLRYSSGRHFFRRGKVNGIETTEGWRDKWLWQLRSATHRKGRHGVEMRRRSDGTRAVPGRYAS